MSAVGRGPSGPFPWEMMEQQGPGSKRQRTVAGLPVCSFSRGPVYDHKTGERLAPHVAKIGRQTECEAMIRPQLFETCTFGDPACSRQEGEMFMAGRDEGGGGRWTIRAQQARCDGSDPRHPI